MLHAFESVTVDVIQCQPMKQPKKQSYKSKTNLLHREHNTVPWTPWLGFCPDMHLEPYIHRSVPF